VLADAATAAVFTGSPHPLVLAEAAAATVSAPALLPLVLTEAAAAAVFALAPHSLVHADAAATTVFALAPLPLVLTEDRGLAEVTPELRPGPTYWLGSHLALRACDAFLVAAWVRAPPAFYC